MTDTPIEMPTPASRPRSGKVAPLPSRPRTLRKRIDRLHRLFAAWQRRYPRSAGVAIFAVSAFAFFLANKFQYWIFLTSDGWAIYWPYDGLVTAILLLTKRRNWHWIIGGSLSIFVHGEYQSNEPIGEVLTDLLSNTAEILLATAFLPHFGNLKQWMMQPHLAARFTAFAILLAPALTGLPVAWYFGITSHSGFWYLATKWSCADALGNALSIPLVLILCSRETYALFRPRAMPETLALLTALFGITWLSFSQGRYPLAFVPYPMLLFVALRLGFPGAVLGANMLTFIASYQSLHGRGPFFAVSQNWNDQQTVLLQGYSTLAMLFVLPLSIMLVERLNFEEQLQKALWEMKKLATVDQLTGVANRRQFDQSLEVEWNRALREGTSIALLMIDADHFKAFNDQYGHVAGDACLRQIAAALQSEPVRPHDLVARYGGEEFAAILPGAPADVAHELAQQMRRRVTACTIPHERNPPGCVTVSIGCASVRPTAQMLPGELIAAADRALYKAKEGGRNCVFSEPAKPRPEPLRRPA